MVESASKIILPKSPLESECFKDTNNVNDFLCTICYRLPYPDKAVEEVKCGHIFCEGCLKEWTKIKQICPHCNSTINDSQRPLKDGNKIAYRILMELMVNCPTGCSWSGAWNELDKHLANCEKSVAPCKYAYIGCLFEGELAERKEHETLKDKHHLELAEVHIEKLNKMLEEEKKQKEEEEKKKRIVEVIPVIPAISVAQVVREEEKKNPAEYVVGNKYKVSVHRHALTHIEREGWGCNGRRIVGGCKSGFTGFRETKGALRFRCASCDYDLCSLCVEAYLVHE